MSRRSEETRRVWALRKARGSLRTPRQWSMLEQLLVVVTVTTGLMAIAMMMRQAITNSDNASQPIDAALMQQAPTGSSPGTHSVEPTDAHDIRWVEHVVKSPPRETPPAPAPEPVNTSAPASDVDIQPSTPRDSHEPVPTFNSRPILAVGTRRMVVTAYSPDAQSCGIWADGLTASGMSVEVNGGRLVAADPDVLPMGSLVSVPGYHQGRAVPVLDVGGAIKGDRLDVLFPTHEQAIQWGRREVDVTVWRYAD